MSQQLALRMVVVATAAASLVAFAPRAEAHHRPNVYCNESGDLCQGATKVEGVRRLQITLAARYFGRYLLCVGPNEGPDMCLRFRIEELDNGLYGDAVRWRRHFPDVGPGPYTVSWYRVPDYGPATERIGRRLGFHVRS